MDPRFNAVRRDLADVRLADRVFAPHYAAPVLMVIARETPLRAARDGDSDVRAALVPGDVFEVFELAGGNAWGKAPGCGLVGYLDETALVRASS
ncbi:SH3 domain-containing protein [Sphingomonas populi]|uniref:SH3 domain-containing protein n=1 Tax=Sphingomonas populi TaxID=2484750 RepID=A0A4Q6Y018_9SPHN|nr:SH3 domain-containing protein [Sphingomonas populi]